MSFEQRTEADSPAVCQPNGDQTRSAWTVIGLVLLPVGCCAVPLVIAAIGSVSVGAVVGGGAGVALLGIAILALVLRRRRCGAAKSSRR